MAKVKFDPTQGFDKIESGPKAFDPSQGFERIDSPSMLESGSRGLAQGLSFGLSDELTGAVESAFTDKDYKTARDESRRAYEDAERANPKSYLAGDIGGSVATAFIPGLGALNAGKGARLAEVAGKAALQGGLTGFGKSEKSGAGLAADTATGAAAGGALGAGGHGLIKGAQKGAELIREVGGKGGLKQVGQAFREGAKEGREVLGLDVANVPVVSQISQAVSGGKRAISEIAEMASARREYQGVAEALKKTYGPGSSTNLSDNDVLMGKLLEGGIAGEPNEAQMLVAWKFAQAHGGGDPEQYLNLLKRTPEELRAAQTFNPIEAGEELAPGVKSAFEDVQKAAGKQYGALKEAARSQFPKQSSAPVKVLSEAITDAGRYKSISGNTRAVLDDTFADLSGREGEASFTALSPQEQFDRILAAKQRLGKAVKWANKNELPEGQQILSDTYAKFQKMLQSLDEMAAADKGYSGFKDLENNLFKKLGTVERGRIKEFDPIKMERLFSGSSTGRQLMAKVQKAREMLERGQLPPESEANVRMLLERIEEMGGKASLKRDMNAFRYGDAGPSSPAIQRMSAIAGKDSATTTAVRAPQMFLRMKSAAAAAAESIFGKPYSQLKPDEKSVVSKYASWITLNDGASEVDMRRKINELLKRNG